MDIRHLSEPIRRIQSMMGTENQQNVYQLPYNMVMGNEKTKGITAVIYSFVERF